MSVMIQQHKSTLFTQARFLALLSGVIAASFLGSGAGAMAVSADEEVYEQLNLFGNAFDQIRDNYVEEVDEVELIQSAITGMLTSLDPHSAYLPPEDYDDMQEDTQGSFGGLGIEVTQTDGLVKVVTPMDDTPAMEAGVQAGDFITHVDGESLIGLTLDEAVELMRGPIGSDVVVTILREGVDDPFDLTITRDQIRVPSTRARAEGEAVVLRVSSFNQNTYTTLKEGIEAEVSALGGMENVTGFVLDLRNNPGGLLSQAIAVSDAFLDMGEIVSTRGRGGAQAERYNAEKGDLTEGKPLVVLINEGSASASEIVAGALQDHHRAVVVGTRSFGKGSVQSIIPVGEFGAIKLTTGRYYTPSGRSIQALGVQPDIFVERVFEEEIPEEESDTEAEFFTRSEAGLRGSLENDSLTEDEQGQLEEERARQEEIARQRRKDNQLATALDILKSLAVIDLSRGR